LHEDLWTLTYILLLYFAQFLICPPHDIGFVQTAINAATLHDEFG